MKEQKQPTKAKKHARVFILFLVSIIFVSIAASVAIIGFNYIENQNFKESFHSVSSLKVNNKIRIIQISDLHNCSFGKNNSKLINRVKKLKPDLILFTGDILDSKATSDKSVIELCETLAEVAPSYYIYGNNEVERFYDVPLNQKELDKKFGFDDKNRDPEKLAEITDEFTAKLEASGVKVLKNEHDTLTIGTTNVDVYGVLNSNPSSFWSYSGEKFNNYLYNNTNHLKITAIHEPVLLEEFTPETWGDLVLAGHNHGGLVKIPMIGPLYTHDGGLLPNRNGHYTVGRYEVQGRPLIVSAGLENTNLFRLNNPPEITIVDINKF